MQPNQNTVNIDLKNTTQLKCPCGSEIFDTGFKLFKVSALASPYGQESVVPLAVFICRKCGEMLE